MRKHSPYNYAFNNPIRFIDQDGMAPTDHIFNSQGKLLQITPKGRNIFIKTDEGKLVNISDLPFNKGNMQTIARVACFYGTQLGVPSNKFGVTPGRKNALAMTKGDVIYLNNTGGQINKL